MKYGFCFWLPAFLFPVSLLGVPLDQVMIYKTNISIVQDLRLPPYCRIETNLLNESTEDLSGEWRFGIQRGHITLRQSGLGDIRCYLWGDLKSDTLRKSLEILWISDIDEAITDTLRIPLDWRFANRNDQGGGDEWKISEIMSDPDGQAFVNIFIPAPSNVALLVQVPKRMPIDTLFIERQFRGEKRIDCSQRLISASKYNLVLQVNGVPVDARWLTKPRQADESYRRRR